MIPDTMGDPPDTPTNSQQHRDAPSTDSLSPHAALEGGKRWLESLIGTIHQTPSGNYGTPVEGDQFGRRASREESGSERGRGSFDQDTKPSKQRIKTLSLIAGTGSTAGRTKAAAAAAGDEPQIETLPTLIDLDQDSELEFARSPSARLNGDLDALSLQSSTMSTKHHPRPEDTGSSHASSSLGGWSSKPWEDVLNMPQVQAGSKRASALWNTSL